MTSWVSSSSSEKAPRCSCSCHSTKQTSARRWEGSFAALAQKLLHITRMRDKCLKDFNETVIVDDLYPADGVGLMLRKCVHVANNTFTGFPEYCIMSKSRWLWWSLLGRSCIRLRCIIMYLISLYPTTINCAPSKVLIHTDRKHRDFPLHAFVLVCSRKAGNSFRRLHITSLVPSL